MDTYRRNSWCKLIVLCSGVLFCPVVRAEDAPSWAQTYLQSLYAASNAGDAAAVAGLYSDDAVYGKVRGRSAILSTLTRDYRTLNYKCVGHFDGFREIAETAVGWGEEACTVLPRAAGARAQQSRARWLLVFERQADGRWLGIRETWQDLPD